jgi:hypothetical protein
MRCDGKLAALPTALFYYDQRIRLEGYDIERMMDSAGLIAPPTPPSGESQIAPVQDEAQT